MSEEPVEYILKDFPGTRYYPRFKLTTWHPQGILDEALADKIIAFIESEEYIQDAPFDRYTDFSGITEVRVSPEYIIETARHRMVVRQPVKSAFFGDKPATFDIAQIYERLMDDAIMIRVQSFSDRKAAGEWLEVPPTILEPSAHSL
jgi:hypothetical protein